MGPLDYGGWYIGWSIPLTTCEASANNGRAAPFARRARPFCVHARMSSRSASSSKSSESRDDGSSGDFAFCVFR